MTSTMGAPNRYSLWLWSEKDISNRSSKQKYMSSCEVKLNDDKDKKGTELQNENKVQLKPKRKVSSTRNDHRKRKKKN